MTAALFGRFPSDPKSFHSDSDENGGSTFLALTGISHGDRRQSLWPGRIMTQVPLCFIASLAMYQI